MTIFREEISGTWVRSTESYGIFIIPRFFFSNLPNGFFCASGRHNTVKSYFIGKPGKFAIPDTTDKAILPPYFRKYKMRLTSEFEIWHYFHSPPCLCSRAIQGNDGELLTRVLIIYEGYLWLAQVARWDCVNPEIIPMGDAQWSNLNLPRDATSRSPKLTEGEPVNNRNTIFQSINQLL